MVVARTPFEEALERGQLGERVVVKLLQDRGWSVIPTYDYVGRNGRRAPALRGTKMCVSVPDIDAAREGDRRWFEVKTFNEPQPFRKHGGVLVHGFKRRLFDGYSVVERETGCAVWVIVIEVSTADVLCFELSKTEPLACACRQCASGYPNPQHDVYFKRDDMRPVCHLDDETMAPIRAAWARGDR